MEVIARCRGNYPFADDPKQTVAYVEVFKENLTEQQIHTYQLKTILLKQMGSEHFIKLIKTYREGNNIMMLYQYCETSIDRCIKTLSSKSDPKDGQCKECLRCFTSNLNQIIDFLVHFQVRVDLLLQNFAVVEKQGHFQLKLFVQPDSQFMALQLPSMEHDQIKAKMKQNRNNLKIFYETQKKRIIMDYTDLLEEKMGKMDSPQKMKPNFTINGCKLIFLQNSQPQRKGSHQQSPNKQSLVKNQVQPGLRHHKKKSSYSMDKMHLTSHSRQKHLERPTTKNLRKQFRDKFQNKIKEIKANLKQLQFQHEKSKNMRNNNFNHHKVQSWKSRQEDKIEYFQHEAFFDKLERQLKKETHKESKQENKIYNNSPLEISNNSSMLEPSSPSIQIHSQNSYSKTQSSFNQNQPKTQKYKIKITTSHDVEVEKITPVQIITNQLEVQQTKEMLQKLRQFSATPTHAIQNQTQQREESLLHFRRSDLGPRSSLHVVQNSTCIPNVKGSTLQSQEITPQCKDHVYGRKPPNSEEFCDKVREAKWRAERILREYCRSKH